MPPAEWPIRMTWPLLREAASLTRAATACVLSSWVSSAMGERSAAKAELSNGRASSELGGIALAPAPGRSSVITPKHCASSNDVTRFQDERLCHPPWTKIKIALLTDLCFLFA